MRIAEWIKLKAGAIALAFFVSTGAAQADTARDLARCVQSQLAALGQDVGTIDGLIGPRTRRAAAKALETLQADGKVDGLPGLTRHSAVTWCRELSDVSFRLNRYRPGLQPPQIAVPDVKGPAATRLMERTAQKVEAHFRTEYGIRLASRVHYGGDSSTKGILTQAKRLPGASKARLNSLRGWADEVCDKHFGVVGIAYRNAVYFCWPSRGSLNDVWAKVMRANLEYVMAHELMHMVQQELAQDIVPRPRRTKGQSNLGPNWMVEGAAVLIADRYIDPHGWDKGRRLYRRLQRSKDKAYPLKALRPHQTVFKKESYDLATAAVHVLVRRHGVQSLFDYWREVGQTGSASKAFEAVYGQSLGSFEAMFDDRRANFSRLWAFAKGEDA